MSCDQKEKEKEGGKQKVGVKLYTETIETLDIFCCDKAQNNYRYLPMQSSCVTLGLLSGDLGAPRGYISHRSALPGGTLQHPVPAGLWRAIKTITLKLS